MKKSKTFSLKKKACLGLLWAAKVHQEKNNLKFGTLSGNKWVEQMKGTFFTGCMSNLFFESSVVIFCCTLVHEFALLFYCSRNYTAIIERKIACITVNFEWIPNFATKQHFRSRLPLKFPSREPTEHKRRCHAMFCGGNKTLVSNITAPWWSELPRGWKEVFCNTEETKLKFSCVTLKNKISACKVALWITCEKTLHLGESRFTRHKWRAC